VLRGSDYDEKKGVKFVGEKDAWSILLHLRDTCGPAAKWSAAALLQAVKEKGQQRAVQYATEMHTTHVLRSFRDQLVWTDDQGTIGSLSEITDPNLLMDLPEVIQMMAAGQSLPDAATGKLIATGAADPEDPSKLYSIPQPSTVPLQPVPQSLQPTMVAGGQLPAPPEQCSVADLKTFLKTRNLPGSDVRPALVALANAMLKLEASAGGALHVRDPKDQVSLGDVLQANNAGPSQYDTALTPPLSGYTQGEEELSEAAPLLSETVFEDWLAESRLSFESGGFQYYTESYARGVSRCMNLQELRLSVTAVGMHGPRRRIVWLRDKVPRSQAADNESNLRTVNICLEVSAARDPSDPNGSNSAARPPTVKRVLKAICNCTKGKAGCAHKVCTLYSLMNLDRPDSFNWPVPCTSKECNWRKPAASKWKYDRTLPIQELVLRQQAKAGREAKAKPKAFSERKPRAVSEAGEGRHRFEVRSASIRARVTAESPEIKEDLAAFLYEVDKNAH